MHFADTEDAGSKGPNLAQKTASNSAQSDDRDQCVRMIIANDIPIHKPNGSPRYQAPAGAVPTTWLGGRTSSAASFTWISYSAYLTSHTICMSEAT